MNIEETAERHVFLGEALVLAERKGEALWHYGRAADLYEDREYKVGEARSYDMCTMLHNRFLMTSCRAYRQGFVKAIFSGHAVVTRCVELLMPLVFFTDLPFLFGHTQISTLVSLGQVQTEEGYSDDAVETYLQVLSLQEDEDPDEVADAHVQASGVCNGFPVVCGPTDLVENIENALGERWYGPPRV